MHATRQRQSPLSERLDRWPVDRPRDWLAQVNRAMAEEPLKALRRCVARGAPWGTPSWQARTADRLGLDITLRPRGRPRKEHGNSS